LPQRNLSSRSKRKRLTAEESVWGCGVKFFSILYSYSSVTSVPSVAKQFQNLLFRFEPSKIDDLLPEPVLSFPIGSQTFGAFELDDPALLGIESFKLI